MRARTRSTAPSVSTGESSWPTSCCRRSSRSCTAGLLGLAIGFAEGGGEGVSGPMGGRLDRALVDMERRGDLRGGVAEEVAQHGDLSLAPRQPAEGGPKLFRLSAGARIGDLGEPGPIGQAPSR